MMILKIKLLSPNAIVPTRATEGSAGYDLSACLSEPMLLKAGETLLVPTGIAIELPENTAGMVYPRSGLASKHGLTLANSVGVIDSDYRGEIKIPLYNHSSKAFLLHSGDRIAQLVVTPILLPDVEITADLTNSTRNTNGFGSSGMPPLSRRRGILPRKRLDTRDH